MLDSLRHTLEALLPPRRPGRAGPRFVDHERARSFPGLPGAVAGDAGVGGAWHPTVYGEYYARSADVHAAVKLRAEAVSRPPLVVYLRAPDAGTNSAARTGGSPGTQSPLSITLSHEGRGDSPTRSREGRGDSLTLSREGSGDSPAEGKGLHRSAPSGAVPAGPDHPVQRLLDTVNPWLSTAGLLTATETHLCLWGAAFWYLERAPGGGPVTAIWPLRPDRVRVVRDPDRLVAGFLHAPPSSPGRETPLLPEEVVWLRYFNPLDDHAGFSPLAAARLTADMGIDALRFNREFFRNGAHPQDLVFRMRGPASEEQIEQLYARLDQRFQGPGKAHRPLVTGESVEVQRMGIDQRDMEWLAGLRWSLETVARVYGVPLPLLEDFSHATLNNVREARRLFWEKTVVPELVLLQSVMNDSLLPRLGTMARGASVAFDLGAIEALSESESERTKRHVALVKAGIMTVNEVRRERGLAERSEQ